MFAEGVELHRVRRRRDGAERQRLGVDALPGGRGQRDGEPDVVEGGLAGARQGVDHDEPPARPVAHRIPEAGTSIDPLWLAATAASLLSGDRRRRLRRVER
jgi:hypothetical protein